MFKIRIYKKKQPRLKYLNRIICTRSDLKCFYEFYKYDKEEKVYLIRDYPDLSSNRLVGARYSTKDINKYIGEGSWILKI